MLKYENYNVPISKLNELAPGSAVNLVLSGGGEKGVAHVALLEKLEDLHIKINAISATSAGSLVGAMYASGTRPEEMLKFFTETPLFRYSWLTPLKSGIFKSEKYETYLKDIVRSRFENLGIPLYITATDMENGESHYFHQGPLIRPLIASCAVPGIFSPVEIDGILYSDGGVMDNFPIFPFKEDPLPIIGSYVVIPKIIDKDDLDNPIKVTGRSATLMGYAINRHKFFSTYLTVVHQIRDFGIFDQKHGHQIYEKAREDLFSQKGPD
jgi:NTE family protein